MTDHEVFNQEEFWVAFKKDLDDARARVLIECPFLSSWRLRNLEWPIRSATNRGVVVCVFLQQETANNVQSELTMQKKEREFLINMLLSWGVHINERNYVHSKVAIIDDQILWDGSLNILCHNNRVHERMNRFIGRQKVKGAIQEQLLDCRQCRQNLSRFVTDGDRSELGALGRVLKLQREWQNQTQADVADLCGLDRSIVSRIENGHDSSIKSILSVCNAIDADLVLVPNYLANYLGNALEKATAKETHRPPLPKPTNRDK